MNCPICESNASIYFQTKILNKYNVQYFRCSQCQFIFTESPYWLNEAYNSAITKLDIGLITRNELMVPVVKAVINMYCKSDGRFVDYGGGYGMLVRMMRDRGFDYYRQDIYCDNLYAELFDISDVPPFKADLLTAFEVFEHLVDPVKELEKMLALSDNILFSTNIQPTENVTPESWWYFIPETGQHVALYSRASLQALAKRFGLNYCWDEQNIHFFSRKTFDNNLFKIITNPRWGKLYNKLKGEKESLMDKDFLAVRNKLKENF